MAEGLGNELVIFDQLSHIAQITSKYVFVCFFRYMNSFITHSFWDKVPSNAKDLSKPKQNRQTLLSQSCK